MGDAALRDRVEQAFDACQWAWAADNSDVPYEFPLKFPNPQSRAIGRIAQFEVVLFTAGPLLLAALNVVSLSSSAWTIPYTWVLIAIFYFRFGWMKGKAILDIEGVSVKSRVSRQSYPWRDIDKRRTPVLLCP